MVLHPTRRALLAAALAPPLAFALVHCGDDSSPAPTPSVDASTFDASTTPDPVEASVPDTGSPVTDGGVEAGPVYDDAGCLIPSGPLPDPGDAGIPATGLVLWLRADRGLSTTQAGAVCRWDDLSGRGNTFAPPTQRPALAPTGLRGRPAVTFTGENTVLRRADVLGIVATSARTVAAFGATADLTGRFNYFYQGNYATNDKYFGLDQNTFNTTGSKEGVYVTGNAYDSNVATTTAARSHVYTIDNFAVGNAILPLIHYDVDGAATTLTRTAAGSGNGNVEDFSGATRTEIGLGRAGFGAASLGELIVYSRALDATERAALNTYFQARFAP